RAAVSAPERARRAPEYEDRARAAVLDRDVRRIQGVGGARPVRRRDVADRPAGARAGNPDGGAPHDPALPAARRDGYPRLARTRLLPERAYARIPARVPVNLRVDRLEAAWDLDSAAVVVHDCDD